MQIYNQAISYPPQNMQTYGSSITLCNALEVGDFNKDGYQDLVLIGISNEAKIYLNNGSGEFTYLMNMGLAGSNGTTRLVTADFNNDGYDDFAVSCVYGKSSTVAVCLNTSSQPSISPAFADWAFSTATTSATDPAGKTISFLSYSLNLGGGYGPAGIAVGNFQGQATMPDLVLTNTTSNSLGLLVNRGSTGATWNGFAQTLNVDLSGIDPGGDLTVGDFDGSGIQDDVILVGSYENDSKPVPSSLGGYGPNYSANSSLWLLPGHGQATSSSSGFSTPQWIGVVGSGNAEITTIPRSLFSTTGGTQYPADGVAVISSAYNQNTVYNTQNVYVVYDVQQTRTQFRQALNPNGNDWIPLNAGPEGVVMYQVNATDIPSNQGFAAPGGIAVAPNGMIVTGLQVGSNSVDPDPQASQIAYTQNALINTLPFQFGQSTQNSLLNLNGQVDTSYLPILQGGQSVSWSSTSAFSQNVNPSTPGSTNLVVPPSLIAPGLFLSWTPAQVTGLNGSSGQQLGGLLSGWNLVDSNRNPIALSTLAQLFGTAGPTKNADNQALPAILPNFWNSSQLTPADKNRPTVAYNGGWFYLNKSINNAPTTWADAFFN